MEITLPSSGIHRGRLANVMTINISELLPKKYQKIFSKILKIFGKYFHFSDFENLKFFQKSKTFEIFQKPNSGK